MCKYGIPAFLTGEYAPFWEALGQVPMINMLKTEASSESSPEGGSSGSGPCPSADWNVMMMNE